MHEIFALVNIEKEHQCVTGAAIESCFRKKLLLNPGQNSQKYL